MLSLEPYVPAKSDFLGYIGSKETDYCIKNFSEVSFTLMYSATHGVGLTLFVQSPVKRQEAKFNRNRQNELGLVTFALVVG